MKKLFLLSLFAVLPISLQAMEKEEFENAGNKRKREETVILPEKSVKTKATNLSYFDLLPKEIRELLLAYLTTASTLDEAIKNIKTVCAVNSLSGLVSDFKFTSFLINQLAINFKKPQEIVAIKLATSCAIEWLKKEYLAILKIQTKEQAIKWIKGVLKKSGIDFQYDKAVNIFMALIVVYPEVLPFVINFKDATGYTALMCAARQGYNDLIALLLKKGIDPNVQDDIGQTALAKCKDINAFQLLLQYKANPNIQNNFSKRTILHDISYPNVSNFHFIVPREQLVRLLLEHGANPNIQDITGNTPLMKAAAHSGNDSIVTLLLQYGADPLITNLEGKTALTIAQENRKYEIAEIYSILFNIEDHKNSDEIEHWFDHLK